MHACSGNVPRVLHGRGPVDRRSAGQTLLHASILFGSQATTLWLVEQDRDRKLLDAVSVTRVAASHANRSWQQRQREAASWGGGAVGSFYCGSVGSVNGPHIASCGALNDSICGVLVQALLTA
jgi:hypothetical protein